MAMMSLRLLREVSGAARMALLSWLYKTMRYLQTQEEVTGKRPVWSVLTFTVNSTVYMYAILVLYPRFLKRKGRGRHNRRIGDGSGGRSGSGGLYVLPVLA